MNSKGNTMVTMDGEHMTKDEALDLALEALENSKEVFTAIQEMGIRAGRSAKEMRVGEVLIQDSAITAIKQARALDKMAENARELGQHLCKKTGGRGRMNATA
jgi:hypothetical protein